MKKTNGAFTEIWEHAGCYRDTDRDCGPRFLVQSEYSPKGPST